VTVSRPAATRCRLWCWSPGYTTLWGTTNIDPSERQKTAALIMSNDVLSVFSPDELREKFDWYCSKLESDFDFGKIEATATIAKLKTKQDQARGVIQIGIIIGGADGFFDDDEKAVVRSAAHAVGIDPAEFDL
jgi:tellurite resistance protein TerB